MPVLKGRKTDKEKFAGAEATYTIEAMMKDGKALQSGTSHYFGDKFSRAYDVTFTGRDNKLQYPFQTSWGASTRLIGAVIMTHGDDNGLVLPPGYRPDPGGGHPGGPAQGGGPGGRLRPAGPAPEAGSAGQVRRLRPVQRLEVRRVRDEGACPLRVEIGPKDMEKGQCVIARRDTGEKYFVPLEELEAKVTELLKAVHTNLYESAKKRLEENIYTCETLEEVKEAMAEQGRLCRDHVVRQPGVRAGHEGEGWRLLPVHAPGPEEDRRLQVRRVRQERRQDGGLGRGLLIFYKTRQIERGCCTYMQQPRFCHSCSRFSRFLSGPVSCPPLAPFPALLALFLIILALFLVILSAAKDLFRPFVIEDRILRPLGPSPDKTVRPKPLVDLPQLQFALDIGQVHLIGVPQAVDAAAGALVAAPAPAAQAAADNGLPLFPGGIFDQKLFTHGEKPPFSASLHRRADFYAPLS